jgi:UDP-N-acetylglucosamine 2-epimerase (non-hydrolysing)
MSVILVIGTRPDAIKLIPVYKKLKQAGIPTLLCATNQHRELLDQVCNLFNVQPDVSLNVMIENQNLEHITSTVLHKCTELFSTSKPSVVIVQGDTTSSFAAALAAYYLSIPIAHVEAGLRTWDIHAPFPEEANRTFITTIASLHFAPTPLNLCNLLKEGVKPQRIFCVGNTVVDALFEINQNIEKGSIAISQNIRQYIETCKKNKHRIVLLTTHRRESFNGGLSRTLQAIIQSAQIYKDLSFFFPVHPNPHVQEEVEYSGIKRISNITCSPPLTYQDLCFILAATDFVITDSGGIQEEAVSLGKHVAILRDSTERIEATWDNIGVLVGTNKQKIMNTIESWHTKSSTSQPCFIYGDGTTAQRIVQILIDHFGLSAEERKPLTTKPLVPKTIPFGM